VIPRRSSIELGARCRSPVRQARLLGRSHPTRDVMPSNRPCGNGDARRSARLPCRTPVGFGLPRASRTAAQRSMRRGAEPLLSETHNAVAGSTFVQVVAPAFTLLTLDLHFLFQSLIFRIAKIQRFVMNAFKFNGIALSGEPGVVGSPPVAPNTAVFLSRPLHWRL
jgi:hypothetical protein